MLSFSEIQEYLNRVESDDSPILHISILRNIMIEPIVPYLRYLGHQSGFTVKAALGEYDTVFQEAVGGEAQLFNSETDFVIIFLHLESVSLDLSRHFPCLNNEARQAEVVRVKDYITQVLSGIRRQCDAVIFWHGFLEPLYPAMGIMDYQNSQGQMGIIHDLNGFAKLSLGKLKDAYFVDLNLCLARLGGEHFFDNRYWHLGRAPFKREALQEIAQENCKFIRALNGKNKKCLVLDCDNTLWGGIIGEDGLSGIKLGQTFPGSAFHELQQEIINLYNRGIILALCSKNNPDDVWAVFRQHPDMLLKEKHIASYQINWDDKATNLRRIAEDLNIGLDSMVFVDDSEFEVNLIRQVLPEVEVIHLPAGRAYDYRDIIASCGLFDSATFSEEDKKRGAMYKAEAERKKKATQFTDMKTYYETLQMVAEIRLADEFSIPRIAQLTQKTNQFNLTTRRYTEGEIKALAENTGSDVLFLHLKDRFGEFGIVGAAILKYEGENAIIDTFLLSCRVLGREVEDIFIDYCLRLVQSKKLGLVTGLYIASRKNSQVKKFYSSRGFEPAHGSEGNQVFRFDMAEYSFQDKKHFKKIISNFTTLSQ